MEIRRLDKTEILQAIDLAWEVFQVFEAPEYSSQGVDEFYRSIHDPVWYQNLSVFGSFEQCEMVGMIAYREQDHHITLFFVKGKYHGRGIGRKLFQEMCKMSRAEKLTVNSSPYAVPVYHKFGFRDTDAEQLVNGIRFIPMEWQI